MAKDVVEGFVVYPTYRIKDNKAYVHLYGRLANGETFQTINEFQPYFFIRTKDLNKAKKLADATYEETEFKNFTQDPLTKVILHIPKEVPDLRQLFEKEQVPTYEADVRFVYRFMIDQGIQGAMKIHGDFQKGSFVDRVYENPSFSPSQHVPKLKTLALDIETHPETKEIYCVSVVQEDFQKVIIRSKEKVPHGILVKDEKELLETFIKTIIDLDPDIITGWNVIDFDLNIIEQRCKKHKIPFALGRSEEHSSVTVYQSFIRDSKVDVVGRMVLDGIHLLKTSFINLPEYTLASVAEEYLGEKKLIGSENKAEEINEAFKHDPKKLAAYNLKDSQLVIRILEKTGVVDLTIKRSLLTGMQLDRVRASVASLDNVYLRASRGRGIVNYNSQYSEREQRIKGGYVRDSIPGLYENIMVHDFKSMYPSIIRTFNIDPYSFEPDLTKHKKKELDPKKHIRAPNGAVFRNEAGILPSLIQTLWQQRDAAKQHKNTLESQAIKILMNSFFGVMANPSCRFYNYDMANAITHFAQHIIKLTADKIKEQGYSVIYGDTDSIFVDAKAGSRQEVDRVGKRIQDDMNRFFKDYVKKEYARESFLELEFDKVFLKFLMPRIRGSEQGAKKRYAGLVAKQGKEKLDITGMEAVRSDWTDLAKEFQEELLLKIFHGEHYDRFIRDYVEQLRKGKHDSLLIYRKRINKPLDEYVKTTPPHVKAARKLKKLTSNLISYVMTIEGPEPVGQVKHDLDYDHYIEKQLKPIADSILTFIDKSFDEVMKNSKQTGLGDF